MQLFWGGADGGALWGEAASALRSAPGLGVSPRPSAASPAGGAQRPGLGSSAPAPAPGFEGHGSSPETGVWITARVEGRQCRRARQPTPEPQGGGPSRPCPQLRGCPIELRFPRQPGPLGEASDSRAEPQPRSAVPPVDGEPGNPTLGRLLEP